MLNFTVDDATRFGHAHPVHAGATGCAANGCANGRRQTKTWLGVNRIARNQIPETDVHSRLEMFIDFVRPAFNC